MGDYYYPGLWERIMEHPGNLFSKEGLASAILKLLENNEGTVIVGPSSPMHELAISTGYCNWGFLEDRFFRSNWAFPLPKGSPFLQVFNNMWVRQMKLILSVQKQHICSIQNYKWSITDPFPAVQCSPWSAYQIGRILWNSNWCL